VDGPREAGGDSLDASLYLVLGNRTGAPKLAASRGMALRLDLSPARDPRIRLLGAMRALGCGAAWWMLFAGGPDSIRYLYPFVFLALVTMAPGLIKMGCSMPGKSGASSWDWDWRFLWTQPRISVFT
jgi:hypothetical protein